MNSCVTHLTFNFFFYFFGEIIIERDLDSAASSDSRY